MSSPTGGKLIIPEELRDTSRWPCPEESALDNTSRFYRLKSAIQMRLSGETYQAILSETSIVKPEVIRQIRRCITESSPGTLG
jgi:hypothetical protein